MGNGGTHTPQITRGEQNRKVHTESLAEVAEEGGRKGEDGGEEPCIWEYA